MKLSFLVVSIVEHLKDSGGPLLPCQPLGKKIQKLITR